mgnify:CR=1 FL=1
MKCNVRKGCTNAATTTYYSVVNGIRCNDAFACDDCHAWIQNAPAPVTALRVAGLGKPTIEAVSA